MWVVSLKHSWYNGKNMFQLNLEQLDTLSDLFLDISKGLLLGAFALPIITNIDFFLFLKTFIMGMIFGYFSLKIIELKGVYK